MENGGNTENNITRVLKWKVPNENGFGLYEVCGAAERCEGAGAEGKHEGTVTCFKLVLEIMPG